MKQIFTHITLFISFLFFINSCVSTTPGDAAYRAGQYEVAANHYKVISDGGDPLATYKLASLYQYNLPDHQKAIEYYKKAYELGQIASSWHIGVIYKNGESNVESNYKKAEQWFRKEAVNGHHYSMYDLAGLYAENSIGPDDIEGMKWLEAVTILARKFKPQNEGTIWIINDPRGYRAMFKERMSAEDFNRAINLANEWVVAYETNKK